MMSALKTGTILPSRFADIVEKNSGNSGKNKYTGELIERSGGGL